MAAVSKRILWVSILAIAFAGTVAMLVTNDIESNETKWGTGIQEISKNKNQNDTPFEIILDHENYPLGNSVKISGIAPGATNDYVILNVRNPDGQLMDAKKIELDDLNRFNTKFDTYSSWNLGQYSIQLMDENTIKLVKKFTIGSESDLLLHKVLDICECKERLDECQDIDKLTWNNSSHSINSKTCKWGTNHGGANIDLTQYEDDFEINYEDDFNIQFDQ